MKVCYQPISSMYKIRSMADIPEETLGAQTLLRGEHFDFQLVMYAEGNAGCRLSGEVLDGDGRPVSRATDGLMLFRVQNVVMDYPVFDGHDDDILTDQPGLMPDLLTPLSETNNLVRMGKNPISIFVSLDTPQDLRPGKYTLQLTLNCFDMKVPSEIETSKFSLELTLLETVLPAQSIHFQQGFHVDSIADAHDVPIYSEKHWELIGKYMSLAHYLGIDTIMTPILTPPLDTLIGTERPRVQLAKIEKRGSRFFFDFSLAERYIRLAQKNGIRNFKISHFFSQWGLKSAPNIYVKVDGVEEKLFGWDTDALGDEYRDFLTQFLPALTAFLKRIGVYDRSYFLLSDEPSKKHLERYTHAHDIVKLFIPDRPIMEAVFDLDFYKSGLIDIPIPATDRIEPFLAAKIPNLWAYYTCFQHKQLGNRLLCFPAYRNRILGMQLFKYDIKGFTQWGFNFYYSEHSAYYVNPYLSTSCDMTYCSGDPFSVYPGKNGPLPTLRAMVFKNALQDAEILKLLAEKFGHERVVELLEKEAGMEITLDEYPRNDTFITTVMEKMKRALD